MFSKENNYIAVLKRDTRVLFHIKKTQQYVMTNDKGDELELLRVFYADRQGKIYMEGYLLGSIFAHNPYIIPDLEDVDCTFEELAPDYFRSNPVVDGLIGQAVGDALGVPYEFLYREQVKSVYSDEMLGNDCNMTFRSR